MDFFWNLSLWIVGPAIILALILFSMVGLALARRWILPRLRFGEGAGEFANVMIHSVVVLYSLVVALIAISAWEVYSEVSQTVSHEASALAALYRDVSGYPEPTRSKLQGGVRAYVGYVIREAWPLQRHGEVPAGGVEIVNQLQKTLFTFDPGSEREKLIHEETLRAYNRMIEVRRLRLDAVETGLPGVMWLVIVAGALLTLSSAFFFHVEDARLQGLFVGFLATLIGLLILLIVSLDRPFRGDLGISSKPYELILHQLMQ